MTYAYYKYTGNLRGWSTLLSKESVYEILHQRLHVKHVSLLVFKLGWRALVPANL